MVFFFVFFATLEAVVGVDFLADFLATVLEVDAFFLEALDTLAAGFLTTFFLVVFLATFLATFFEEVVATFLEVVLRFVVDV